MHDRSESPDSGSKALVKPKHALSRPKTVVNILNTFNKVPKASELALEYFREYTKLFEDTFETSPASGKIKGTMILQYDDYLADKNTKEWEKYVSDLRPFKVIEVQEESPHPRFQSTKDLSQKRKLISSSKKAVHFLFM